MALIETHLPPEVISGEKTDFENVNLEITAPGLQPLKVAFPANTAPSLILAKTWICFPFQPLNVKTEKVVACIFPEGLLGLPYAVPTNSLLARRFLW